MPPPPPVAEVADAYVADQTVLADEATRITSDAAARRLNADPAQWRDAVADAAPSLLQLQVTAAALADPYLDAVLAAQGSEATATAVVNAEAFADLTDGGGSWMRRLIYVPTSAYRDVIREGGTTTLARARAQYIASSIVLSGMQDIRRSAVTTAMATRPKVKRYVRMLNGTSCARCAVLAGRRYRISAFKRHPRCDCYMIPADEDVDGDWTTDPDLYFRQLSDRDQDAIFTAPGAAAIRAGADINQVVNARRGIDTVSGRLITTEGTTRRGLAGSRLQGETRLMPDEIFQLAEEESWDRPELLRQLTRYGYIV